MLLYTSGLSMHKEFKQARKLLIQQYDRIPGMSRIEYQNYILNLFRFQHKYNLIYQQFCKNIGIFDVKKVTIDSIPFLPISAFKYHEVKTGNYDTEMIFTSSGTTSSLQSQHHVREITHYLTNTEQIWNAHFDKVSHYCFLALLPGYLERKGSSLISMVEYFISKSNYSESGFYLREFDNLSKTLEYCKNKNIPTVLFGVSHALIDFAENYPLKFKDLIIIETGGMKGTRKEITKTALHAILVQQFGTESVYSEYGMTELLSQAYTDKNTRFRSNPFLNVTIKQLNDPLTDEKLNKPGIICVRDVANIDSCAFIQTEDLGIKHADGSFDISGRIDAAEWRGCNLLLQELGIH